MPLITMLYNQVMSGNCWTSASVFSGPVMLQITVKYFYF